MAGMSSYPFKCDLCGGVTDAPTYGDFNCQHCGQAYVYDECHQIKLSEPQLKTLRDLRWIPVSERLPEQGEDVLGFCSKIGKQVAHLTDESAWYWGTSGVLGYDATHWMPLPEPPIG
jgi:hypothetical protein